VINPTRSATIRRSVNETLTREIRSRARTDANSCIFTLTFLAMDSYITEEIQNIFLNTLKVFYDSIGLIFQPPHLITDRQGKTFLIFDGVLQPSEGAVELLELLDPQLIDGRFEFDTSSDNFGVSLQLKATFSKLLRDLPVFNLDEERKLLISQAKDLTFKLKLNSLSDLLTLESFRKIYSDASDEFKTLVDQFSRNHITVKEALLEKFYVYISKKQYLEPELYNFFKAYPLIIHHLDSLQSITLIIKDQVLTLDINFPGLFKQLPVPTPQDLALFSQIALTQTALVVNEDKLINEDQLITDDQY
jgi:hypothetical protein